MSVLMTYLFVASLTPGCPIDVLFLWIGIVSTLGNNVPVTLGTKLGVTLDEDRSLIRLDAVVMAGCKSFFIFLIALLRSVPCLDLLTGWLVLDGIHLCFRSSSAADRLSMELVFGSLFWLGRN